LRHLAFARRAFACGSMVLVDQLSVVFALSERKYDR
jgi:hypothetical protein